MFLKVVITRLAISSNSSTRMWSAMERRIDGGTARGGSTHTVGGDGAGVYEVVVPCVLPPSSYVIYTVAAALR